MINYCMVFIQSSHENKSKIKLGILNNIGESHWYKVMHLRFLPHLVNGLILIYP